MRTKFEEQLTQLNDLLVEMGIFVEKSIDMATEALIKQDVEIAKQAIILEREVDVKEREIETLCLRLLLQQQPVAKDLRLISAALKMISDMERIGDQAADISEIVVMMKGASYTPYINKLEHFSQMADAATKMVSQSIEAFVNKDLEMAHAVMGYDDVVDDLFDAVKYDLIELIRRDKENGEQAIDLLMIAKYFERIGDHAVNIAEWVEFSITGKHKKDK